MAILEDPVFIQATKILDEGKHEAEKMKKVSKLLKSIASQYNGEARLHNAYARLYRRTGEPGRLREAVERAQALCRIEEYPSPWGNLGLFYEEFELWGKAAALYSSILKHHPKEPFAGNRLPECQKKRQAICSRFGLQFPPSIPGDMLLLETVELLLAAGTDVKQVKCRLQDNFGQLHEIDILCEMAFLDLADGIPVIVECKDWTRSVDRPAIDAFRSFLDHSQYKLGMIITSHGFTRGATAAAEGSGIKIYNLSELEKGMETILSERLKGHKVEWVRDVTMVKGPSEEEEAITAKATKRFIELGVEGRLGGDVEVRITKESISVGGVRICRFEKGEQSCYEGLIGPIASAPFEMLLLCMSWWNHIVDLAWSAYAVRPW